MNKVDADQILEVAILTPDQSTDMRQHLHLKTDLLEDLDLEIDTIQGLIITIIIIHRIGTDQCREIDLADQEIVGTPDCQTLLATVPEILKS